ncbi:DUF4150 domain-containing protein [Hyalangium versicolor]|uniref:DUF4150 domain-containing protein n=1 Tax=Hyalangium versicolor TaxID=2861190 RepID=UPI002103ADC9|nr:DUF4150 domain-containing protein [Hyalangium versicolor]
MSKVYANGRSVVHKGDGQVNTCAVPDVCKTPSPGGPVPIPYVNVARDGDLAQGSTSVSIEGNPVALKDSNLSTSSGDEPGTAGGGLVSSKTKGKMTWANASIDVKIEGKGVVRFMDPTQHNGNTFNTAFIQQGGTGFAYGDDRDPTGPCDLCEKPKEEHRILEHDSTKTSTQDLVKKLEEMRKKESGLQQTRQFLETTLAVLKDKGEDTKALSSQIRTLDQQIGDSRVLRKTADGGGYMIGVLVCECGTEIFAAMSGTETRGFPLAVQALGWKLATAPGSPLLNGNGEIPAEEEQRLKNLPKSLPGKNNNPFGVCAAPKLIQAMMKAGHKPLLMTEQLYSPANTQKRVKVRYRKNGRMVKHQFRGGDTVPSCRTCQNTLPCLLCNRPPCP